MSDLTIEIDASTGQATSALDELIKIMHDVRTFTGTAALEMNKFASTSKQVAKVTSEATKQNAVIKILRENWRALSAAVSSIGLGKLFSGVADDARDLRRISTALHVTTRGIQTLDYAATQADVSIGAVRGALESLQSQLTDAAMGQQDAMVNLGFLGLDRRSLEKMDAPERFSAVSEALSRIEDPARRVGVAMRVFGGSAAELQPLLSQTPDQLRATAKEFAALGGAMSQRQIDALRGWDAQFSKLKVSMLTLRAAIAETLLPVFELVVDVVGKVTRVIIDLNKKTQILQYGGLLLLIGGFAKLMVSLRGVNVGLSLITRFFTAATAKVAAFAVLIASIAAVVQDLISAFRGGRSAIAEWIDEFAGLGTADKMIRNIKAGWEAMSKMQFPGITEVLEAMRRWNYEREVMPELKGRIEGLRQALSELRSGTGIGQGLPSRVRDEMISKNSALLTELEGKLFGLDGLRAVGRGVAADVQRYGEMTTGSGSRFERPATAVQINNTIEVKAGAGNREIADGAQRGVSEALQKTARDIQQAVGGRR